MRPIAFPLVLTSILAAGAHAQQPASQLAAPWAPSSEVAQPSDELAGARSIWPARLPIHGGAASDHGDPYGLWGAGRSYKASFHGWMTFVPYLGEAYAVNQSLRWRTQSVTIGGQPIMQAGESVERFQEEYRYEYRFAAVTEAYDVLPEGLEQTFVIDRRPTQRGDLVVTGLVDGPVQAAAVDAAHQFLPFMAGDGNEVIRYGEALVLDADGRSMPIATSHQDSRIQLTVPAGWLENARYPVTVDPLFSATGFNIQGGGVTVSGDVVRDDVANDRLIAMCRGASLSDFDILTAIQDDDWTRAGTVANPYLDLNNWNTPYVRCGMIGSPATYLIAYHRELTGGDTELVFHYRDSGDYTFSSSPAVVVYNPQGNLQYWRPDVGGSQGFSAGHVFMVVFQSEDVMPFQNSPESRVMAMTLDFSTTPPTLGREVPMPVGGRYDQERPTINQQCFPDNRVSRWVLAWQEHRNTPSSQWEILAAQIDQNRLLNTQLYRSNSTGNRKHKINPQIAGQTGRFCLAYSSLDPGLLGSKPQRPNGDTVTVERLDWLGGARPIGKRPVDLWAISSTPRWIVGGIGYDHDTDSHWAVSMASSRFDIGGGTGVVYIRRVGFNGEITEAATLEFPASNQSGLAGGVCYDDDADEFATVWTLNDPANLLFGELWANSFTYNTPNPATTAGFGCSAATISLRGNNPQQIGHEFMQVRVTGAPANASHFMLLVTVGVDIPVVDPLVAPGCRLLVPSSGPGYLGLLPFRLGSTVAWDLALPEFLTSQTVYFQDWHTNATATQFLSTERLEVPIIK